MSEQVLAILMASGVAGLASYVGMVIALKVHVQYLRENDEKQDRRLDKCEDRLIIVETGLS